MKLISLNLFISGVEQGTISEVFSINIGTEKRVYGKSVMDANYDKPPFEIVYAVIP